jgi:hypothetical protein
LPTISWKASRPRAGSGRARNFERLSIGPIVALWVSAALGLPGGAPAQGVSTGSIGGTVRTEQGASVEGARVRVRNTATGFIWTTQVGRERFVVHGLDVGGPYVVDVRHLGFLAEQSGPLIVTLGEPLDVRFVLRPAPVTLGGVVIAGAGRGASVSAGGGVATIVPDSLLHRLPTVNRNFVDFVQLAPQVSTKIGSQRSGFSAAGANLRYNNYLINGVDERFVNANVSPAHGMGKSIPIEAVKEYQVLVAPYDVRYGDFAGGLVNTVTQSGTNEFKGSAFAYWRNDRLARGGDLAADEPYERVQYGFSLGGPVIRDRVHFFIAPELQRVTSPAPGPYVGQPTTDTLRVPVSAAEIARFDAIMRGYGLTAGSGGLIEVDDPLRNLFARVDAAIPRWNSRAIGFVSHVAAENAQFSRRDRFYLSSARVTSASSLRLTSLQLHTALERIGGAYNELSLSQASDKSDQLPAIRQPLVRVRVPGTGAGSTQLFAGTPELAQGRLRRSRSIRLRDDLTLPLGSRHQLALGIQGQRFRMQPEGVTTGYGAWTFASLDAFERRFADALEVRKDFGGATTALRGGQYAAYVGDEWRVNDRVSITMGLRADLLHLSGHAPYNATVDSIFGRRTDEMASLPVEFSPRLGFSWDLTGAREHRLRGGVGVFAGRPPLAWLHPALANYGDGIGVLRCGFRPTDRGLPPAFVPDYRNPPTACLSGPDLATAPLGEVNLLDRELRIARSLRGSLAYDRRLPWDLLATTEFVLTRYLSDYLFVNLNLEGPQGVDRFGRVLYGEIIGSGVNEPAVRTSRFSEVIDHRNTSRNYSYQLSTRVERRFARRIAANVSYTYSRTRDVQSPNRVNQAGLVIWGDGRALSGRHDDLTRGISLNDIPHRAVAAVTYTAPWRRWSTDFSLYYVGESGGPFTYQAGGIGGRGDLNADASNVNDPIYVPRSALDTLEIRFSGRVDSAGADNSLGMQAARERLQQNAFERFIERSSCLGRQRGRILERNSCREPWSHTTVASVRQAVPLGGRALEAELDVFNVLNLLNGAWGRYRIAVPAVLEHVGHSPGPAESSQPTFRFDVTAPTWTTLKAESAFQLQLAVRYRF